MTRRFYSNILQNCRFHSQYPTFIFKLLLYVYIQDIFTEFQSLIFYIQLLLLTTNIMSYKKFEYATTNLHSKKTMEARIIKNIFNKNDSICRDVKTQKVCEQGRDG